MKLSVIIVSYNVRHYLEQCLMSLRKALHGLEAEVYVVDNHSHDGSPSLVAERFPEVHLVRSSHNLGFSRANNIAIRQSQGDYVLLLNPDTIVGEETLTDVLRFMDEHENAGGVGVRMMKTDGTDAMESRRGLPTPMTAFYKMCGLCARFPKSRRFGRYYMSYLPWDRPARIEVISGAFCMLRRKALDAIGLLDEDFFMYGEDIDLSCRLLKGGFENWYVPTRIVHYKGESTQKSSFRYVHVFYEAMLIFFRKHYGHTSLLLSIPIKAAIYLKASVALVQMQIQRAKKSLGFSMNARRKTPLYVFFGTAEGAEAFRQLAIGNALETQVVEGTASTCPEGHLQTELPERRQVYAVYDVEAYPYAAIMSLFAKKPMADVHLGTFDRQSHVLITAEEVLR